MLRFKGAREACFLPYGPGGDLPWQTVLRGAVRTALSIHAPLRAESVASLLNGEPAALPAPPQTPSRASPPLVNAAQLATLIESGAPLPPDVLAEHRQAEAQIRGDAGEQWEAIPDELLHAPSPFVSRAPPVAPESAFIRPPPSPPLDVPLLLDQMLDNCRQLRSLLEAACESATGWPADLDRWTLPRRSWAEASAQDALPRLCAAVAKGYGQLRTLIAGNLGVSSWSARRRGADARRRTAAEGSPNACVWRSVAQDASDLLQVAGYPGFEAALLAPEDESSEDKHGLGGASEPPASVRLLSAQLGELPALSELANPPSPFPESPPQPCVTYAHLLRPSHESADPFAPLVQPLRPPASDAGPPNAPPMGPPLSVRLRDSSFGRPLSPPDSRSRVTCAVCLERPVSAALLECGHTVCCVECASALVVSNAPCPLCRAPILRVVRVFL